MNFFKKVVLNGVDIFCKDSDARDRLAIVEETTGTLSEDVDNIKDDVLNIHNALDAVEETTGTLTGDVDDIKDNLVDINNELEDVSDDIEKIQERVSNGDYSNVVFICDSYGTDSYATPNFITLLKNKLNLDNDHFKNFSRGSTSFQYNNGVPSDMNNGLNFCDVLNYAVNNMTQAERDAVTCVVIAGGSNDYVADTNAAIATGISNFINICQTNFRKAAIECYIVGWSSMDERFNYMSNYATYVESFGNNAIKCFKVFSNIVPRSLRLADGVHPTEAGHEALAKAIFYSMKTNRVLFPVTIFNTAIPGMNINFISEDEVMIRFMGGSDYLTDATVNIGDVLVKLCAFTNEVMEGFSSPQIAFTLGTTIVTNTPAAYNVSMAFAFKKENSILGLYARQRNRASGGALTTYNNVVQFNMPYGVFTVPIYMI